MKLGTVLTRAFCLSMITLVALGASGALAAEQSARAEKPVININTASAEELEELPRIGPVIAQRIVEYRAKEGAFHSVEEIMNVRGIGEKTFLQFQNRITVGEPAGSKG